MPNLHATRQRSNAKSGFTLIELLVVITIIGILATFIVASFNSAQQKARDSRRKSDLDALKKALELQKSDSSGGQYYVTSITAAAGSGPCAAPATTPYLPCYGYIKANPKDPKTSADYTYAGSNCTAPGCTGYTLYACLENGNDPQKDAANVCTSPLVSYTISNP